MAPEAEGAGGAGGAGGGGLVTVDALSRRKAVWAGSILVAVLALDLVTKWIVQQTFRPHESVPVWGDFFRLTFIFNPGAAFGFHVGPHSRVIFLVLSLVALGVLILMFRNTPADHTHRLLAIGAIAGGALGNIVDRIRSSAGVVDFLDFGIGDLRWPVFNVADIAVSVGAILLFLSFWSEDRRAREAKRE